MEILTDTVIFLTAAILAVPLSKRLGLGGVLGYLAAGLIIGPWGLGLFQEVASMMEIAEFGVVLLLFLIGLELHPARLWTMRRLVFGMGSVQVLTTGAVFIAIGMALGLPTAAAVVVGTALALSSTPFALQIFSEKNLMTTRQGRAGFSVMLFQDMAVIPLLAVIPILGSAGFDGPDGPSALAVAEVAAVLIGLLFGGRILLRQVFRLIAATGMHDVLTALALFIVAGAALLMELVGLSMALGAFMAGVLLADSEYRHQLEANIEPFKGLLLGLFFIAVGMSVNVGMIGERPATIAGLVVGIIVIKAAILYVIGRSWALSSPSAAMMAMIMCQGGEFGFVVYTLAGEAGLLDRATVDLLIVVVGLSMVVTPLLVQATEWLTKRLERKGPAAAYDTPDGEENEVIIAGFGRFGQMIARILRARDIGFTALEINPEQVELARRFGAQVYYGDSARLDLLRAARADKASIFVLAVDDVEQSVKIAELVRHNFPNLTIYARARNRRHVHELMDQDVTIFQRDTFLSSLNMAERVLLGLGVRGQDAERIVETFRKHDEDALHRSHDLYQDESKSIAFAKQGAEELADLLADDDRKKMDR